jgi:sensor histidine kinase YesM
VQYTHIRICVCGHLIPAFSSLAEIILGLYFTSSVSYLDINIVNTCSVDYGLLGLVTIVLFVARGISEKSAALFFRVICIGRGSEWNI